MLKTVKSAPIKFKYDHDKHQYSRGDEIIPSVTQLLSEFNLVDFSRVPPERLEFKRVIGMGVDYACELLDQENLDESSLHANFVPYVNAYKKFKEVEKFEPITELSNAPLFSEKWKFGGRPDVLGKFIDRYKDGICLLDRKCTYSMYPSTGPQCAGYEILLEEVHKIKIVKRFGLLLKPTSNYDLIEFKDQKDFTTFHACLWLHWEKRNHFKTTKLPVEVEE